VQRLPRYFVLRLCAYTTLTLHSCAMLTLQLNGVAERLQYEVKEIMPNMQLSSAVKVYRGT
jgi:hypothetical protein